MGRGTTCHGNEYTFACASGQDTPCGFCARKSGNLCRPRCTFSPLPRDAGVKSLRKHHQHVCGSIDRSQLQQLRCRPCRFSCVHAVRHRKQWLKCVHSGTGDLQGWKTSYHRPLEFAIGDDADASPAASSANMLRGFTSDHAATASRQRDPAGPHDAGRARKGATGPCARQLLAARCLHPSCFGELCVCGPWPWALRSSQPHTATHTLRTRSTHTQQARNSGTRKPHPLRARERIAVQHSQAPAAKNDIPPHASTCPDAAGPMPPAAEVLLRRF